MYFCSLWYENSNACFPNVGAARTPYLMYDVYTNDSKHGLCFPTLSVVKGSAVQCNTVQYSTVQYSSVHYIALYCIVLYCIILYCIVTSSMLTFNTVKALKHSQKVFGHSFSGGLLYF